MFFGGESKAVENYKAGVAITIQSTKIKHMLDIEPINDRLMTIQLKAKQIITIINTYIPQAERTEEDNTRVQCI